MMEREEEKGIGGGGGRKGKSMREELKEER